MLYTLFHPYSTALIPLHTVRLDVDSGPRGAAGPHKALQRVHVWTRDHLNDLKAQQVRRDAVSEAERNCDSDITWTCADNFTLVFTSLSLSTCVEK